MDDAADTIYRGEPGAGDDGSCISRSKWTRERWGKDYKRAERRAQKRGRQRRARGVRGSKKEDRQPVAKTPLWMVGWMNELSGASYWRAQAKTLSTKLGNPGAWKRMKAYELERNTKQSWRRLSRVTIVRWLRKYEKKEELFYTKIDLMASSYKKVWKIAS